MKLALALALAICAVRKDATAAAVERGGRHPSESRRLASEVGGGGSKRSTPPPVPSSKRKVKKKQDSKIVIGVVAGAIAAVFLFILCAGCFMFHDQWKREESSPLLPEPE